MGKDQGHRWRPPSCARAASAAFQDPSNGETAVAARDGRHRVSARCRIVRDRSVTASSRLDTGTAESPTAAWPPMSACGRRARRLAPRELLHRRIQPQREAVHRLQRRTDPAVSLTATRRTARFEFHSVQVRGKPGFTFYRAIARCAKDVLSHVVPGASTCTAPGFLDIHLRCETWRSSYSSAPSRSENHRMPGTESALQGTAHGTSLLADGQSDRTSTAVILHHFNEIGFVAT